MQMKRAMIFWLCLCCTWVNLLGQETFSAKIFFNDSPLQVKLSYSLKKVRKTTNDSTYLETQLYYVDENEQWQSIDTKIRKRGNFRLRTCYYPPLKIKMAKKGEVKPPFSENRKFKLVSPCFRDDKSNDLVVKEFIAYKLYEKLSPYHFKTKLLDIDFEEVRSKNAKKKRLKGFLIEDIDDVAKRLDAKQLKRKVHPLEQDAYISIINAFFQCMIGNTDFSTGYQHNEKLLFKGGESYPVPYDFDMSGLVNPPYATVSQIQGKQLPIQKVTQRLYRGFIRERNLIFEVRDLFLGKKKMLLGVFDEYQSFFERISEHKKGKDYVIGFFDAIEDYDKFESMILHNLREKSPLDTIRPQ
ncbi:MAG: hypothetical protein AAF039_04725 [Bacteroidota bacterium]